MDMILLVAAWILYAESIYEPIHGLYLIHLDTTLSSAKSRKSIKKLQKEQNINYCSHIYIKLLKDTNIIKENKYYKLKYQNQNIYK